MRKIKNLLCAGYSCKKDILGLSAKMMATLSPDRFYQGPEIFNTVTWDVSGTSTSIQEGHLDSVGHQRLWNFINGMVLDTRPLLGDRKVVFSTAISGTFYLRVVCDGEWVLLPIDGREGWLYGFINEHGCFEFHNWLKPYLATFDNWTMLKDCKADYSSEGLCPNGLENIMMGSEPVQEACINLARYKGELPVPEEVKVGVATLLAYGPESVKSNLVLHRAEVSLSQSGITTVGKMGLVEPFRRWSKSSDAKLFYCASNLCSLKGNSSSRFDDLPSEEKQLLDEVCIVPFNRIIDPYLSRERTWTSYPVDNNSESADGRPSIHCQSFAGPWPLHKEFLANMHPQKILRPDVLLCYLTVAKKVKKMKKKAGKKGKKAFNKDNGTRKSKKKEKKKAKKAHKKARKEAKIAKKAERKKAKLHKTTSKRGAEKRKHH